MKFHINPDGKHCGRRCKYLWDNSSSAVGWLCDRYCLSNGDARKLRCDSVWVIRCKECVSDNCVKANKHMEDSFPPVLKDGVSTREDR
jgi:hypothetical protein